MKESVQAYRVEAEFQSNGSLTLNDLPFKAGDRVDVIVLTKVGEYSYSSDYSLRDLPLKYDFPYDSVGIDDWNASE